METYDEDQERLADKEANAADECAHCDGTGIEPEEFDGRQCSICQGLRYYGS